MELMEAAATTTGKGNTVKNESNIDGNSSNNRSNNKRLKLSLPLSPMLGSLPPSPLSPLFTAINNSNSISSNNSKGSNTNGNSTGIPFTTSSWWKNGSRASSISESLSKSQDGINSSSRRHREDKTTSSTAMNTYAAAAATARTVSSPSSLLSSSSKTRCAVDTTVATAKDTYQNGEDSLATATGSLDPYFLKSSSNSNNNNNAVASALVVMPTNATTVETASIIAASILSSIPQYAATNRLQNYQQQRLNVQLDQQGMHQHQQQHLHRHYQHPYQYHQQQQQLFQSSASSGDDVYVQRIKQPAPTPIVRMETNNNIIDILRSSPSMGGEDIISSSTNIAELPPSPDVERELQESYQEDASFDDENEENVEKLRQTNKSDNDNGNTNNNNRYNNPVTNVDNDDDLAFSDIEEIVPDIVKSITATPTSGSYQPPPADAQPLLPPPVFDGVHIELNDDDDDDVADDDDDDDCNNRINDRNQIIPHAVMSSSSFNINTDNNNNNDDYDNDIGQFSPYYSPLTETANIVAGVDADEDVYADADVDVDTISSDDNQTKEVKFRVYQAENWTEKFEDLLHFREINGHCLVPNKHPENPALAQWIKRQRYQYKLKIEGKRSTITNQRVTALEDAGFVWDSHKAVWAERLEELNDFQEQFGHCNVPSRYEGNHQLAIWVKRQRRQRKYKIDSLPNCMTDERQQKLEELGFVWDMKKQKRA